MRATDAVTLILALMVVWSFYRAHKDPGNEINIFDLIMDQGRISKMAFAFITTLGVTSWIMIRLTVEGKLSEGYFTGYGLMWVAPLVAKLFSAPPPPSNTTTTTTTSTAQEIK